MKTRVLLVIVALLEGLCKGYSQNYVVKEICELPSDLIARTEVHMDKNGHECAAVRVYVPSVKRIEFGADVIVSKAFPGEYVLYVPENTQKLSYFIDEKSKGIIDFSAFQIELKGKCTYKCVLQRSDKLVAGKTGTLKILSNPDGAIVFLDGEPVGETPLELSNVSVGKHKIGVDLYTYEKWFTRPDTIISIAEGKMTTVSLQMESKKHEPPMTLDWGEGGATTVPYKKIENNGKKGIVDLSGRILVPCKYDHIDGTTDNNFFKVWIKTDKKNTYGGDEYIGGLYKAGEKLVIPINYDGITLMGKNWVSAWKNNKGAIFNRNTGKQLTPHIYDEIWRPKNGYCKVMKSNKDRKTQYIKLEENELKEIPYTFDIACDFNKEGFAVATLSREQGGNCVILNAKNFSEGKGISTPYKIYNNWTYFSDGLCPVLSNGKYGAIDTKGQLVVPAIYDEMSNFLGGSAYVEQNGKDFYISQKGNVIEGSESWKRDIDGKQEYLIITKNGKQGIMHRSGKIVVPCEYDKCEVLGSEHTRGELGFNKSEYFSAIKGEICYLYGEHGLIFTCPDNCRIYNYDEGFFTMVDLETKTRAYINVQGDLLTGPIYSENPDGYEQQYNIGEGLLIVWAGHRCGYMNTNGEIVVPMDYVGVIPFMNGKSYVQKQDGKWIELERKTIGSRP